MAKHFVSNWPISTCSWLTGLVRPRYCHFYLLQKPVLGIISHSCCVTSAKFMCYVLKFVY